MKIAIVKFHALGDMVMASGAFNMLRQSFPEAEITLFTYQECQEIVKHNPDISKFILVPASIFKGFNILFKLPFILLAWRKKKYDLVVSFQVSRIANLMAKILKADKYIIPGEDELKSIVSAKRDAVARGSNHYLRLHPAISKAAINKLGRKFSGDIPAPSLQVCKQAYGEVSKLLRDYSFDLGEYMAIFPGGGKNIGEQTDIRQYPAMAQAIKKAVEKCQTLPIIILGGKYDYKPCNEIERALPKNTKYLNLQGQTSLQKFIALIDGAGFLLTVDSSALHIGSARKKPIIAIFGPTDYKEKVYPHSDTFVFSSQQSPSYFGKFKGDPILARKSFVSIKPEVVADKIIEYYTKYIKKAIDYAKNNF